MDDFPSKSRDLACNLRLRPIALPIVVVAEVPARRDSKRLETKGFAERTLEQSDSGRDVRIGATRPQWLTRLNLIGRTRPIDKMDTLGIEPRASRMLSGCDTTTPCARLNANDS